MIRASYFIAKERLPLLPNGKMSRNALLEPAATLLHMVPGKRVPLTKRTDNAADMDEDTGREEHRP